MKKFWIPSHRNRLDWLALAALALLLPHPARAADAPAPIAVESARWGSGTLPAGSYKGSGKTINVNKGSQITWTAGSLVEDGKFYTSSDNNWTAKGCLFRNLELAMEWHSRFEMTDCYFDRTTLKKAGSWYDTSNPSVKWRPTNCVFSGSFLTKTVLFMDSSVRAESCTFVGMQLPHYTWWIDGAKEAQSDNLRFEACKFIDCDVPESFLMATDNCLFEGCRFGEKSPKKLGKAVKVTAFVPFASGMPASYTNGNLSVEFKSGNPPKKAGSTLVYTRQGNGLSVAGIRPAGTPRQMGTIPEPKDVAKETPKPSGKEPMLIDLSEFDLAPATIRGTEGAAAIPLAKNQTSVNGLVVIRLSGQEEAGAASRLSAISLPIKAGALAEVKFNQSVGSMMRKALAEVAKFIQLRHRGWPRGERVEISFPDKYSPKDGPSAAVACALILDSLIAGWTTDPAFAVTGDLNADGTVQPIGGVSGKVRGATKASCTRVAVPMKNTAGVADVMLTEGIGPISAIQIFSIATFDEAKALATSPPDPKIAEALEKFTTVQKALAGGIEVRLGDPQVQSTLREVLALAPNHLSAKLLLARAAGRAPRTLSARGSIETVDTHAGAILRAAAGSSKSDRTIGLNHDALGSQLSKLRTAREKVHPLARTAVDAVLKFGDLLRQWEQRPAKITQQKLDQLASDLDQSAMAADAEWKKLVSNKDLVEEMIQ